MSEAADERLDVEDVAERTRGHCALDGEVIRVEATVLVDDGESIGRRGLRQDRVGLVGADRERLLDDDMLASADRSRCPVGVAVRRCRYDHEIDVLARDQGVGVIQSDDAGRDSDSGFAALLARVAHGREGQAVDGLDRAAVLVADGAVPQQPHSDVR